MKLVTYRSPQGSPRVGALVDGRVVDVHDEVVALAVPDDVAAALDRHGLRPAPCGMLRLLQAGPQAMRRLAAVLASKLSQLAASPAESAVELLAPVPRPGKIVAVGRNYADHAKETGVAAFEQPRIIAKLPSSVIGPNAQITRPAGVSKLDFEVELAVVIGSLARGVRRDQALSHVAGYTVLNDLSAREFQFDVSPAQTTFAKSMDGFCPMGPYLVTCDEITDPQALAIRCHVNGVEMQHGHTADMIFTVAHLIEYVSGFMTLEPGDVIATGTPAGVGAFRTPPQWLQPGDRITMQIAGIGSMNHQIVAA